MAATCFFILVVLIWVNRKPAPTCESRSSRGAEREILQSHFYPYRRPAPRFFYWKVQPTQNASAETALRAHSDGRRKRKDCTASEAKLKREKCGSKSGGFSGRSWRRTKSQRSEDAGLAPGGAKSLSLLLARLKLQAVSALTSSVGCGLKILLRRFENPPHTRISNFDLSLCTLIDNNQKPNLHPRAASRVLCRILNISTPCSPRMKNPRFLIFNF